MYQGDIVCAHTVQHTPEEIRGCSVFRDWAYRAETAGIRIKSVFVAEAFQWEPVEEPRMLMLRVEAYYGERRLDPSVFLRGDTVCVVATLLCEGVRYGVLGSQVRLAGASTDVLDFPSGMIDSTDYSPRSAALRELIEETNSAALVEWKFKVNLSEDLTGSSLPLGVSEGGTDEGATFVWMEAEVERSTLDTLQGAIAGVASEGERIALLIELWRNIPSVLGRSGRPCMKALHGWLLVTHYLTTTLPQ